MKCTIHPSNLRGKMICPPSKSYTHRAIFAASLADGQSIVHGVLYSRDTRATINACRAFGAQIVENGVTLRIVGRPMPRPATIDAQNSGTTIRIASAIASLVHGKSVLTGDASLCTRPMGPLLKTLESMGARCKSDNGTPPITIDGPIAGGNAEIDGTVSSQFITALLMSAPCTPDGMLITIGGNLVSRPYIDATISVMKHFGVDVMMKSRHLEYFVAPHRYRPASFSVPSDYSILALLLAASILTGDKLELVAGDDKLPQGDIAFLKILESMGIVIKSNNGVMRTTTPQVLQGGTFKMTDTPDLLPPLAILALKCNEPIQITGIEHARTKETDRIDVLAEQLRHMGIHTEQKFDSITLCKTDSIPKDVHLDASEDHRIFMALCIACMYTGGSVEGAESVTVSYPNFLDEMRLVGAKID